MTATAELAARPTGPVHEMANAIRALAIDAVEAAKSGHPGMPMGMAELATVLWSRYLTFDPADPHWPDRDRFVLSNGHGSMLLYAALHLTGHAGMEMGALASFRQLHSPAAGHPEYGAHPAIEMTTGPLGQGIATAVGMALAERMLAARFGSALVDHRTYVFAGDGCLMEGISQEAIALAGHLRLSRLCVIHDDNAISIDGPTALASSEDIPRRFVAAGWAVRRIDGHDPRAIAPALAFGRRATRPTLISARTIIGFGAPHRAGTAAAHGAPLGAEEAAAAKAALGWDSLPFTVPAVIRARWEAAGRRGAAQRLAWQERLAAHPQRTAFERAIAGELPAQLDTALAALRAELAAARPRLATRQASQRAIAAIAPALPELVGGSADLTGSNLTHAPGMAPVVAGDYAGRYVHFGVREHGMAACLSGLALHGGFIPYGGTFLCFVDYMRPALRLAALMRQRVIYVLTHDSIGLGEDGPTHQPIEHLASLRAIPNLYLFRPADAIETAEAWEIALRTRDRPCLIVLSRQTVPTLRSDTTDNRSARGGYVLAEAEGPRQATLIATGSEVAIALEARTRLAADGIRAAVVSLPCWERFATEDETWHAEVLGTAPRFGIEAASGFGWERWLGPDGVFIGLSGFGASAPAETLYRHFGLTAEAVAAAVRRRTLS